MGNCRKCGRPMAGHPPLKGDKCTLTPLESHVPVSSPSVNVPASTAPTTSSTNSTLTTAVASGSNGSQQSEKDLDAEQAKLQAELDKLEQQAAEAKRLREKAENVQAMKTKMAELARQIQEEQQAMQIAASPLTRSASLPSVPAAEDPPPVALQPAPSLQSLSGILPAQAGLPAIATSGIPLQQAPDPINVIQAQMAGARPKMSPAAVISASPYAQAAVGLSPNPVQNQAKAGSANQNRGKLPENFVYLRSGKATIENINLPNFFHGYCRMLESMLDDPDSVRQRIVFLKRIASLAVNHQWDAVKHVYTAACKEVEDDEREWDQPLNEITDHLLNQSTLLAAARPVKHAIGKSTEVCLNHNNKEEGCKRAVCKFLHVCLVCSKSDHRAYNCPAKKDADPGSKKTDSK